MNLKKWKRRKNVLKANTLEQTLTNKLEGAKVRVQEKLFKQFVLTKEDSERAEIGHKMNVLTDVVRALNKELKETE
jgi:hypothetical protein